MKRLDELSWTEVHAARERAPIVLVPVGSTEAHGPHLPLGTDVIISEALAHRVSTELERQGRREAWIAPTVAYAITDYAAGFAGTISLSAETATQLVADLCSSLIGHGLERVCLINSHLEPAHVASLREACARVRAGTGIEVAFPDKTERRWARTLTEEFKRGACHAGRYETSLVLAARPELVRDRVRAELEPRPIDLAQAMRAGVRSFAEAGAAEAYFGDPAAATREEGEAIYRLLVEMVTTTIEETWPAAG